MAKPAIHGDDENEFPARSFLFLPANRLEWVKKVQRFKPHAVILDLEDAVPPAEKLKARGLVPEELASLRDQGVIPFVRINAFDAGGYDDVLGVVRPGLGGIMLPKVEHPDQVKDLHDVISYAEGKGRPASWRGAHPAHAGNSRRRAFRLRALQGQSPGARPLWRLQ
ncbi:MAG: aldolase/citrate lyase family protein [Alphaproteobacteria bacterium]